MLSYNIISNISKYILFLLLITPIFINLNITDGLRFDANPFNYLGLPSIPISLVVISLLVLYNIKIFLNNHFILFFLLMLIFLNFNIINGTGIKAFIVFLGMIIPLISYHLFCKIIDEKNSIKTYKIFYKSLLMIFFIKFISDYFLFKKFVSPFFIFEDIAIYNYYDYFPFYYYLLIVLSLYNIFYLKWYQFVSCLVSILVYVIFIEIDSRLYQYGVLLLPMLAFLYYFTRFKLSIYFNFSIILVLIITLYTGLNDLYIEEASFAERFGHWKGYLNAFNAWNIFFPFYNEYRIRIDYGSFHNELIEHFSYFGWIVFYYYFIFVKKMFINVDENFKMCSFLLMFILIFGTLIQSNFSNPYIGILLGLILSITRKKNNKNIRYEQC